MASRRKPSVLGPSSELREVRDSVLESRLPFLESVLGTSVGPKIVGGAFTDEVSLQFIVRAKVPSEHLRSGQHIPPTIEGFPTDVLRGRGEISVPEVLIPSDDKEVGYGARLARSDGKFGTASIGARGMNGSRLLLTSAHVVRDGDPVLLAGSSGPRVGVVVRRVVSAWGDEIYGALAANPSERIEVDLAAVLLEQNVVVKGGLPGGHAIELESGTQKLASWLPRSSAAAYGAGTKGWLQGTVTGLWPRRPKGRSTGLCSIQHAPRARGGDSGCLWVSRRNGRYFVVGNHWGLVGNYAFVSDLTAALPLLGADQILQ
jgi:hypothetical protein